MLIFSGALITTQACLVAVEADYFRRFGQEGSFIAGMDGMAVNALLVQVGFVEAARTAHRLVVAVEAELIGRGLGGDFFLLDLVASLTVPLDDRFVEIIFEEIRAITCVGGMALKTASRHWIIVMGLFKDVILCLMTGVTLGVWFAGQK
jgi:hypothetical protein